MATAQQPKESLQPSTASLTYATPIKSPSNESKTLRRLNVGASIDLDRLAQAVSAHETVSCTQGYGKTYNNCFGIKNGSIAPCKRIGVKRMCIYNTKAESYVAFKKIWAKGYKGEFPTIAHAEAWTGKDRASEWLSTVTKKYYNHQPL